MINLTKCVKFVIPNSISNIKVNVIESGTRIVEEKYYLEKSRPN